MPCLGPSRTGDASSLLCGLKPDLGEACLLPCFAALLACVEAGADPQCKQIIGVDWMCCVRIALLFLQKEVQAKEAGT